jgi:hypothetical protein
MWQMNYQIPAGSSKGRGLNLNIGPCRETDVVKNFTPAFFFHFSVSSVFPVNQFGHSDHIRFVFSFTPKLNALRLFAKFVKTHVDLADFFLENLILKRKHIFLSHCRKCFKRW